MLVRGNAVAGTYCHAHQRIVLGDDREGCGAQRRSDAQDREDGQSQGVAEED